jgi:hypothetical protein
MGELYNGDLSPSLSSCMLDYSIRGPLTLSISPELSVTRIPPSLASAGPTGMTAPEREQAAPTTVVHT